MIHAYDRVYLDKARNALGRMLDYAVNDMHQTLTDFYRLFLQSGLAKRFGDGDYSIIVGHSGVELACEVLANSNPLTAPDKVLYAYDRSEEYWTGWALAYYQWDTGMSFMEIDKHVPIADIYMLYMPFHEMDIRQFVDKMNELYRFSKPETNLKYYRAIAGFSQKELADITGVPVRTIQQYEQRQKDINKASVTCLLSFAQALCCDVGDLVERVPVISL